MDDMYFLESVLRQHGGGMLVEFPPVSPKCQLGIDIETLLVSEEYDTSVRQQPSKIILLVICKVLQLDTTDLSSDLLGVVKDFRRTFEQTAVCRIPEESLIFLRDSRLNWVPFDVWEGRGELVPFVGLIWSSVQIVCDSRNESFSCFLFDTGVLQFFRDRRNSGSDSCFL